MSKAWVKLLVASVFEVGWVVGIAHADTVFLWIVTVIASITCFYLLVDSTEHLPVGTSYAIFVGLGASGVTIFDFVVFKQPFDIVKIILIGVLLLGVVGLKLVTDEKEQTS